MLTMKMVLLAAKGGSMTIISAALCIRESTVVRHLTDYVRAAYNAIRFVCPCL